MKENTGLHIAEALLMTISKFPYFLAVASLLVLLQEASYADGGKPQYNKSVKQVDLQSGKFYIINDYYINRSNINKYRLYSIVSLRAKDQLLKKLQKDNKELRGKSLILKGFTKDKCLEIDKVFSCKFSVPVSGVSFVKKEPSAKAYFKKLDMLDSISVVGFNKRRYVVSLSTGKANNLSSMEKLKLMKSTKLLAKNNLLKFSKGEDILYDFSYLKKIDENILSSEIKLKIVGILDKLLQSKLTEKNKGISYMWRMLDDSLLHYAYIEIPKD
jgi:hypothetical protein